VGARLDALHLPFHLRSLGARGHDLRNGVLQLFFFAVVVLGHLSGQLGVLCNDSIFRNVLLLLVSRNSLRLAWNNEPRREMAVGKLRNVMGFGLGLFSALLARRKRELHFCASRLLERDGIRDPRVRHLNDLAHPGALPEHDAHQMAALRLLAHSRYYLVHLRCDLARGRRKLGLPATGQQPDVGGRRVFLLPHYSLNGRLLPHVRVGLGLVVGALLQEQSAPRREGFPRLGTDGQRVLLLNSVLYRRLLLLDEPFV